MRLRHDHWSRVLILLFLLLPVSVLPLSAEPVGQTNRSTTLSAGEVLRFGFSGKVFADINEADGLAAVQVWSESFAESNELVVDVDCRIFEKLDDLKRALVEGQVDLINISIGEYPSLRPLLDTEKVFLSVVGGDVRVEYLLLVNADHPARGIEDLESASLLVLDNLQTSIAPAWLESHLRDQNLPRAEEFFSHITMLPKSSQAILPVFFNKTDACLVSRGSYETAIELNPQIGHSLRVVGRSPRLIPGACFFRDSYQGPSKTRILETIEALNTQSRGQQVLLLFKTDRILVAPGQDLESTLRVIENGVAGVNP